MSDLMKAMAIALGLMVAGPAFADAAALDLAKGWLGALREKDAGKLKAATEFPFTEAGIGPGSRPCGKKAKAASAAEFNAAADCMISDATFVGNIPPSVDAKTISLAKLEVPTFKKNLKSLQPLAKDHTFVQTTVTGDGITYQVLLAVKKGVSLVLVDAVGGE
jgi:hypothetical protein